mmetsp:Transcript_26267/g.52763  ORF Transcript_26267/g.52763 Transcript_26267/m.52763 type:complete len:324 (-) Transcript_26267:498-1469(-)
MLAMTSPAAAAPGAGFAQPADATAEALLLRATSSRSLALGRNAGKDQDQDQDEDPATRVLNYVCAHGHLPPDDDDDDDDSALPEWAVAVLVLVTWRVRFWRCRICRWLSEMLDSESPRNLARKEDTTLKGSFSLEDKICITWKGGRILSRSISFKKSPSKSYASSSSSSSPHSLIAAFVDKLPTSTPPTPPPSPPVEQPPVSWVVVECLKAAAAYSSLSSTNSQRATKCPNTFAHKFGLGLASAFDCRRHTRITSSNSPAKKWPSTSSSVKFSSPPPPPLLPPSLPPPPPLPPAAADADATDIAAEGAGGPSWLLLIFSKRKC